MTPVEKILRDIGPARTGRLVTALTQSLNSSPQAARQRLSRTDVPILRHSEILPKREAFFYLTDQHNSERYWENLLRDLREANTIYACAIDGLDARGGIVPVDEFHVVSGAPINLKKQVPSVVVAKTLIELGVMEEKSIGDLGRCYVAKYGGATSSLTLQMFRSRRLVEGVMLDGLRMWMRRNGVGSSDKIAIRGEDHRLLVGQFKWDLTGPSYLFPLRRKGILHGFVVADVFWEYQMNAFHIRYFLRKVQTYQQTSNSGLLFPVLMATGFTSDAIREGRKAGLMLTTPQNLFGMHVAEALDELLQTLLVATTNATVNEDSLYDLLGRLSEIDGRAGNMRGILFELMTAYIASQEFGGTIRMGVLHTNSANGKSADLDVVCVTTPNAVHLIECKGKGPGATVSLKEVENWLGKLPIMQNYVASQDELRERKRNYAFWTTGKFDADALAKLDQEKEKRIRHPISWRDGKDMRETVTNLKLRTIGKALDEHFLRHPLSSTAA